VIATLAWKDYREQRHVWLALVVLAALAGVTVCALDPPWSGADGMQRYGGLILVGLVAVSTYGLVCGAMLLAGEREAGTLPFLDALAARRRGVWSTKVVSGVGLTLVYALTVSLIVLGMTWSLPGAGTAFALYAVAFPALGVEALVWGLLFSARGRTVLPAVGGAGLALAGLWYTTFLAAAGLGESAETAWPLAIGGRLLLDGLALGLSRRTFCREDRARVVGGAAAGPRRVVWWLAWCQAWPLWPRICGTVLVVGLAAALNGWPAWPLASLLLGVLCGVAAFAPDHEGVRFLGDGRVPPGRVWRGKVCFWLLAGCGVAVLLVLELGVLQAVARSAGSRGWLQQFVSEQGLTQTLSATPGGGWLYLTLWPAYGFACGQLFGIAFRKSAVAVVVAAFVAATMIAFWIPTLVMGTVWAFLPLVPPLILLIAGRLAVGPWLTGRLTGVRGVAIPSVGLLLAAAAQAAALGWRVVEVPDVGQPFDVAAFRASLPPSERNEAGQLLRSAVQEFRSQANRARHRVGPPGEPPINDFTTNQAISVGYTFAVPRQLQDAATQALATGWPTDPGDLGRWLDELVKGEWVKDLRAAVRSPRGAAEVPRDALAYAGGLDPRYEPLREAALILAARSLQLHARGDVAGALDQVGLLLALSRQLRDRSAQVGVHYGRAVEKVALDALDRWLADPKLKADLLRNALQLLERHDKEMPALTDNVKAQYMALTAGGDDPATWLQALMPGGHQTYYEPWLRAKALALQAPWERERARRVLNFLTRRMLLTAAPQRGQNTGSFADLVGYLVEWGPFGWHYEGELHNSQRLMQEELRRVRLLRLRVAARLHALEVGRPAASVQDLVPRYLSEVPTDPTAQWLPLRLDDALPDQATGPDGPGPVPLLPWE
jgi:hypothetical protein